ncbi:MAG TPA: glycosyltransferase [Vicinamibacterales bacterium]
MKGPVHFIHLGGALVWQNLRAVVTAHVHGGPICWWGVDPREVPGNVEYEHIRLPRWQRDHPVQLANVKDFYAYSILHEHGGIYLDMDTISLRPAWDLLTADVCPATDFPDTDTSHPRHNTFALLGRKGAPVLRELAGAAEDLLREGCSDWGALGPSLISAFIEADPAPFSPSPYLSLSGWSYHTIDDYYREPRDPGEPCRVIHLYSSDHPEWLEDRWMPTT